MRTKYLIVVAGVVALAAAAGAFEVAWFYGPNLVIGDANDEAPSSPAGLKCRISSSGNYRRLAVEAGVADYIYRGRDPVFPWYIEGDSVPTVIFTAGGDFGRSFGRWRPYVGGGAALAVQIYNLPCGNQVEGAPGLFAQAGVRCRLGERWALEAGPRFTFLLDNRITGYERMRYSTEIFRADERSKFVDLLVGFDYTF